MKKCFLANILGFKCNFVSFFVFIFLIKVKETLEALEEGDRGDPLQVKVKLEKQIFF